MQPCFYQREFIPLKNGKKYKNCLHICAWKKKAILERMKRACVFFLFLESVKYFIFKKSHEWYQLKIKAFNSEF